MLEKVLLHSLGCCQSSRFEFVIVIDIRNDSIGIIYSITDAFLRLFAARRR